MGHVDRRRPAGALDRPRSECARSGVCRVIGLARDTLHREALAAASIMW